LKHLHPSLFLVYVKVRECLRVIDLCINNAISVQ
jgi:hypothetical protein